MHDQEDDLIYFISKIDLGLYGVIVVKVDKKGSDTRLLEDASNLLNKLRIKTVFKKLADIKDRLDVF